MGPETRRALDAFGPTDLVLGDAAAVVSNDVGHVGITALRGDEADELVLTELVAEDASAGLKSDIDQGERSQIRQLVERIERFTSGGKLHSVRTPGDEQEPLSDIHQASLRSFPFETDAEGTLIWVGEASRAALVGLTIAQMALPGETGADGHVAGAFARRSSFQHGRFYIGEGLYEGEWRFSAVPFFDPGSGRFQGYRGQARRPLVHEIPHKAAVQQAVPEAQPSLDSVRQLIHELRTPLNAIMGFSDILSHELFGTLGDGRYRGYASDIRSAGAHLLSLVDDLLELSKVEAGKMELSEGTVRVGDVTGDVTKMVSAAAAKAKVAFVVEAGGAAMLRVDQRRLTQVLLNLCSNAIKFTPESGVVRLSYRTDGGVPVFQVSDTGIGMTAQQISVALTPFGQVQNAYSRKHTGTGLGLPLSRRLVEAMGGSFDLQSEPGRGTRICIRLPQTTLLATDEMCVA